MGRGLHHPNSRSVLLFIAINAMTIADATANAQANHITNFQFLAVSAPVLTDDNHY